MFKLDKHLDSSEKMVLFFRPSRRAYIHQYVLFGLMFALFLIFFFELMHRSLVLRGVGILCLLIAIAAIIMLGRLEYRIWSRSYGLTNERLMYSRGIFSEHFKSSQYGYVTDIALHQTLWDKIMNTGTVSIDTAGTDNYEIKYRKVYDPFKVKRMINDLMPKNMMPKKVEKLTQEMKEVIRETPELDDGVPKKRKPKKKLD